MAGYFVLDEADLFPQYEEYKSHCHSEERFHKVIMFNLLRYHATTLRRFAKRQSGEVVEDRNLWNEFSNPAKKKDAAATAKVAVVGKPSRKRGKAKPLISDIKGAFRSYIEKQQHNRCCYCRRWLSNSGYSKPIEHILPRKTYEQYSFHFWNLSVACVDCNGLKKEADWANPDKHGAKDYPLPCTFTEMFHPRFHRFDEHVRFIRVQTNDHTITLYRGITPQGKKLCDDLLTTIASKELLVNANAALRSSMETIERFDVKEGGDLELALKSLVGALSERSIELLKH
ncbi:HNH endonuclease [Pseudomonas piscis]|uniref:HNH endonuclease n=1 Tax=Pseudomonas piscis TaxID=2614538 RepID=UPI0038507B48